MKKLLFLSLILGGLISTTQAQGPATKQQPGMSVEQQILDAKAKQAPPMAEKTGLTLKQAETVIEINYAIRQQAATALRDLSDADRSAKIAELKALKEKRYSEIPLSPEQIKAVYAFYEDMGKAAPKN
jgi:hypothetical protein